MSEAQPLATHIPDIKRDIDLWNNWYIFFVAVGVLLAALVFIAQIVVIQKSRRLVKAEEDLSNIKEREGKERVAKIENEASLLRLKAAELEKQN